MINLLMCIFPRKWKNCGSKEWEEKPTYNKVVDLYLEGKYDNVKFTVKGGRSMIYDLSDTEDRRTVEGQPEEGEVGSKSGPT